MIQQKTAHCLHLHGSSRLLRLQGAVSFGLTIPVARHFSWGSKVSVFRWKNCYADVATSAHGTSVRSFLDDVVEPSIQILEDKLSVLSHSDDPIAAFAVSDADDVLRATKMAYGISIQSIWERQLRGYLQGCAAALRPKGELSAHLERGTWPKLRELFLDLRGIGLEEFPSFSELDTLQLVGNACRHGDGPSAKELAMRCPELWPSYLIGSADQALPVASPLSVALMNIPIERLRSFAEAIITFWDDMEYIYNESIVVKHPSLEARLEQERKSRAWIPLSKFD